MTPPHSEQRSWLQGTSPFGTALPHTVQRQVPPESLMGSPAVSEAGFPRSDFGVVDDPGSTLLPRTFSCIFWDLSSTFFFGITCTSFFLRNIAKT